MYSVQEDREESSIENNKEHTKLYVSKNRRCIANTEDFGNRIGFEYRHCKGYPRNGAEGP